MRIYTSPCFDLFLTSAVVLFLVAMSFWGCNNAPLSPAPTPDAPCGVSYLACQAGPGAPITGCCDEGTACCTGEHCPKGYCAQVDDDDTNGYGKRHMILTPQVKPYLR